MEKPQPVQYQQPQHPLVNKFFYKFYNYNIEDNEIIKLVPLELYNFALAKIIMYKTNESLSSIDSMKHNSILFANIKTRFPEMHDKLVKEITELNK